MARNAYVKLLDDIEFNKEVLNSDDEEMRELAKAGIAGTGRKKGGTGKAAPQYADTKRSV